MKSFTAANSPLSVLITGGAGFIGGCLVRQLLLEEPTACIINFDKLTYAGNLDSISDAIVDFRHVLIHGDICDAALLNHTLHKFRPSAIVHLAAESHVDRSIDGPAAFVQTNDSRIPRDIAMFKTM